MAPSGAIKTENEETTATEEEREPFGTRDGDHSGNLPPRMYVIDCHSL